MKQGFDSGDVPARLDRHTLPYVGRPRQSRCETANSTGALREHLKGVPSGTHHDIEDVPDEEFRYRLVEQVAHAVDEHSLGLTPTQREIQLVAMKRRPEARPVARVPHRLEAHCEPLGVAVLATRANLRAPRYGIPRGVGPLDGRVIIHARQDSRLSLGTVGNLSQS